MIPLTIADEVQATLLDYLNTTFNFQDHRLEEALDAFLTQSPGGMFQGPFVQLRLPFRKAAQPDTPLLDIMPSFTPYLHQSRAFARLTSKDNHTPQPTLITTGTGSGKTEAFLYPILDHCTRHRETRGIKAIILYPMNALATDQAGRLAASIWQDERLRGSVTAGLYIGGKTETPHTQMGATHLIDDRTFLRQNPPDILLTNYRMLDFLLLRPEDKPLWTHNTPDTLRYLVLDELHTYDGAQGSDVACLIRRLQARLHIPDGVLCPIGTSATVAATNDTSTAPPSDAPHHSLTAFAAQIFNTPFPPEAVVTEDRLTLAEFLPDAPDNHTMPTDAAQLAVQPGEAPEPYRARQMRLWLGTDALDPLALGSALQQHSFLRTLLTAVNGQILPVSTICHQIGRAEPDFAAQPEATQTLILQSFLALVAHARREEDGRIQPFLTLQVQFWVREMSRLLRQVSHDPAFFWQDDVSPHSEQRGLPAYICRECGHSGWLTTMHDGDAQFSDEAAKIYRSFFDHHKNTFYLYPGANSAVLPHLQDRLCPKCLSLGSKETCELCQAETIPIIVHRTLSQPKGKGQPRDRQQCPICGTEGSLGILGRQAASLLSVAISFLYTSPLNQEKKLLAFTDSVQDASHRAAFFGARTYRFNVRTAFQSVLEALNGDGSEQVDGVTAVSLTELTDRVITYWLNRWQTEAPAGETVTPAQKLAATFMPPDLHNMPHYRRFIDGPAGPLPHELAAALQQRLSWEVTMEYGFNARIGRSLEKVGSSTAFLDPALVETAVDKLALILRNEIGLLRDLDAAAVQHFVIGLLERTRLRGGVAHPLLRRYAEDQGNWYLLTKKVQPLLSPFAKRSPRFPRFLTDTPVRDVFDLTLSRNPGTWTVDWARRVLSSDLGMADINELYRLTLPLLAEAGLLQPYLRGQAAAYGVQPEALWVTNETAFVRCDVCGQRQTVTPPTVAQWRDHACLNFRCAGHYQPLAQSELAEGGNSYYRGIYERGQVERIYSQEHTGLLQRDVREKIETGFRSRQRADDPNLLTATPTLEMGIDVGDLSATIACSVPPSTANYLQRIGRAGRKTGNAFILTLANVQPHDLYYFDEPLQMIAGEIVPPGCFLDAPNMLKRQFLAFTMDNWTAADPQAQQLPRNVKEMLARVNKGGFPTNLLSFYRNNKEALLDAFLSLFGTEVSAANQALLRGYVAGNELVRGVETAVSQTTDERQQLRNQYRSLRTEEQRITENRAQYDDPDEELAQIDREMKLIVAQLKSLEEKYILTFFTDAGLLPNYAFPETGVYLNAIITGIETASKEEKRYLAYEYVRPAPVAIRELAPFNTFYAQGHKVRVNSVDVRGKDVVIERWQFCDQCAHMAPVSGSHYSSSCPRCGSELWHDTGQQHDMIQLRNVAARTDAQQSFSGDDAEEREREYYQTGTYFEVDREQSRGAYLLPGLPFGIEHLNQVVLRELNFGLNDSWGQKVTIAAEERPENGYFICPGCGVVLDPRQDENTTPTQHARTCPTAKRARKGDTGPLNRSSIQWHNLYLYRTMTSEALRLLLPVSTVFVGERLATFQACLDLGLRLWFRGNPIHLNIAPMDELSPDGTRRRFLIIYDAVPGGTSYLRDLAEPDSFYKLLKMTLDRLTSCRCRHDVGKQACYRCLYTFRTQYQKELISRQQGVELLQEILAEWPELTPIESLSDADLVSLIESELEQRFLEAMATYADKRSDVHWQMRLRQGRAVWQFTAAAQTWIVEPQVHLGPDNGVAVHSRPDFVIWPLSHPDSALPVAVFTDGFAFHALPQHPQGRIGDDIHKREAIRASGKFRVWSLTWDDVVEFAEDGAFTLSLLEDSKLLQFSTFLKKAGNPFSTQTIKENGMRQLLRYLEQPDATAWEDLSRLLGLAHMIPPRPPITAALPLSMTKALREDVSRPSLTIPQDTATGQQLYGIRELDAVSLLVHAPMQAVQTQETSAFAVTLRLEDTAVQRSADTFKQAWRHFLLLTNLFQFLPGFVPVTAEKIQQFGGTVTEPDISDSTPDTAAWADVYDYALPECEPLLQQCQSAQTPPPTVGYELVGADGKVIAMAELAWVEGKTAVFLDDQEEDKTLFLQAGWQVFGLEDSEQIINSLNG